MRTIDADALKARFMHGQCYFTEAIIHKIDTAPNIDETVQLPKARKPALPIKVEYGYACPDCRRRIHRTIDRERTNYCPYCGKGVKWDEAT